MDHSKSIRRHLAEGKTLDQALAALRADGASISDCIASVRSLHRCELVEAKRIVCSSAAWADVVFATEAEFQALADDEDAKA